MNPLPYFDGVQAKVLTALTFHVEAFRVMLLPLLQPMRCDYKDVVPVVDLDDPRNLFALLLVLGLVVIGGQLALRIWNWSSPPMKKSGRKAAAKPVQTDTNEVVTTTTTGLLSPRYALAPLIFFGILITFFLPSSNIIGYVGFHVAERVLYFPSAGAIGLLCLALYSAIATLFPPNKQQQQQSPKTRASSTTAGIVLFWIVVIGATVAFSHSTMERVPAWFSTHDLWASDFANYPLNPTVRGSYATQQYLDHGRDVARLRVAMEHIVDSAGLISDSAATTDHVTRIAERLGGLGASREAAAALDRAIQQNDEIMRNHAADLQRGIIRVDQRWTNNREGYPHIHNCNYLRSKGLTLMIGSSGDEYPTSADKLAAKELALKAFEDAVAMCREMRRTSKVEMYPSDTDQQTAGVLMMVARASRELNQVDKARQTLEDCVRMCQNRRSLQNELQRCQRMLDNL